MLAGDLQITLIQNLHARQKLAGIFFNEAHQSNPSLVSFRSFAPVNKDEFNTLSRPNPLSKTAVSRAVPGHLPRKKSAHKNSKWARRGLPYKCVHKRDLPIFFIFLNFDSLDLNFCLELTFEITRKQMSIF
jgi:hypothetical protein